MRRLRVVLVFRSESSFVQRDREILEGAFDLRGVRWDGKRTLPKLAWAVARSDVVFSWFAEDHAFVATRLARLFGRRSIVFVGGGDAARRPDLGYGLYLDPRRGKRGRWAITHADRVLVVDEFLQEELAKNAGVRRPDIVVVPLGIDTDFYTPDEGPRTNVLCVAIVNEGNVRRKGLDVYLEAARRVPELPFVLVGGRDNEATRGIRDSAPPNFKIFAHLSDAELLQQFRRAKAYVQVSRYEAFGSALAEAMACGCVPVGTREGGIPHVIGDTGILVPPGDPEATARAIREAHSHADGTSARRRIVERFPLARRREALVRLVESLSAPPQRGRP